LQRVTDLIDTTEASRLFPDILGQSRIMRGLMRRILDVAPSDATVLVTGESGTGKALVARAVAAHSRRVDQPFIKINCESACLTARQDCVDPRHLALHLLSNAASPSEPAPKMEVPPVAGRGRKEDHRRGASAVQMALFGSAHMVCELLGWEEEKAGL